jgi:plastocyanin
MQQVTGVAAVAVLLLWAGRAAAATVSVSVEAQGAPLADVVVALESPDGRPIAPPPAVSLRAIMDQRGKRFIPHVLAVEVGTSVAFPNSDNIRHDVYSFSPPKVFELPLYKGTPAAPVVFDKPGVVVLGCNIHDWMLAFVDVVPTPYFAQTAKAGTAEIERVPPGDYVLTVWAPRLDAVGHTIRRPIKLAAGDRLVRKFAVTLGPMPAHIHRPPGAADTRASSVIQRLEQKFHRFRRLPPPVPPR